MFDRQANIATQPTRALRFDNSLRTFVCMYCRRIGAKSYRERGFIVDIRYRKRERGVDLIVPARLWLTRQIPMVRADSKGGVFSGVQ